MLAPVLAAATIPDALTFAIAAVITVIGALGVVFMRNPVHSALSLVMTLFGIAVLFVEQEADFLAAVQVIVYAGAIVVLFLFVIMLLGVDRREQTLADTFPGQRIVAIVLGVLVLVKVILFGTSHWTTGAHSTTAPLPSAATNVSALGKALFTTYLVPFEATSALLVVAVVGAVVLARRNVRGSIEPVGDETLGGPAALEPPGGGFPADGAVPPDEQGATGEEMEVTTS